MHVAAYQTDTGTPSSPKQARPFPELPRSRTYSGAGRAERPHRHDVDVMRVLAGLTVMVGHSGGVLIGRAEEGSDAWWLGHFAEGVYHRAVPMFFILVG